MRSRRRGRSPPSAPGRYPAEGPRDRSPRAAGTRPSHSAVTAPSRRAARTWPPAPAAAMASPKTQLAIICGSCMGWNARRPSASSCLAAWRLPRRSSICPTSAREQPSRNGAPIRSATASPARCNASARSRSPPVKAARPRLISAMCWPGSQPRARQWPSACSRVALTWPWSGSPAHAPDTPRPVSASPTVRRSPAAMASRTASSSSGRAASLSPR